MLQVIFSDNIKDLADQLGKDIYASSSTDPFDKVNIIVPNVNLQGWLQRQITDKYGVSANLKFTFWERLLKVFIVESGDDFDKLIDRENMVFLVIAVILENFLEQEFSSLRDYLYKGDKLDEQELWIFGQKLANLFFEYENHRPHFLQNWRQGKTVFEGNRMEQLQQKIYQFLCEGKGKQYQSFSDLLAKNDALKTPNKKEQFYFFCPIFISKFHFRSLQILSSFYDVKVYYLNLCREFWQDIVSPQEVAYFDYLKRLQGVKIIDNDEGENLDENPYDNKLLRSWGKPGREVLKSFADLSGKGEMQEIYLPVKEVDFEDLNSLRVLQMEVNHRRNLPTKMPQDTSVQIWRADSQFVEVQAVYNNIVSSLKKDDSLCFDDFVIFCADISSYQPIIRAIFEYNDDLVYHCMEGNFKNDFLEAINLFFDLLNHFTRKNFLQFINNILVKEVFTLSNEEIKQWQKWLVDSRVFRYFDGQEKSFSWQQGLKRLRLGLVVDGAVDDWQTCQSNWSESDSLTKLCQLVDLIEQFYKRARGDNDLSTWSNFTSDFMNCFLAIDFTDTVLSSQYKKLRLFLGNLHSYDAFFEAKKYFSFSFFRQALEQSLQSQQALGFYHRGIMVSSLFTMRSIPFKIVYIMGLQSNNFPGEVRSDSLDLRRYQRQIGDVNLEEKNCYCLLERLMTTQQKLCLSYVSKDLYKGETLFPSFVINELKEQLIDGFQEIDLSLSMMNKMFYNVDTNLCDLDANYALHKSCYNGSRVDIEPDNKEVFKNRLIFHDLVNFLARNSMKTKLKNELDLKTPKFDYLQEYEVAFGLPFELENSAEEFFFDYLRSFTNMTDLFKDDNLIFLIEQHYHLLSQKSIFPKVEDNAIVLESFTDLITGYWQSLQSLREAYPNSILEFLPSLTFVFGERKIEFLHNNFWFLKEKGKILVFCSLQNSKIVKAQAMLLLLFSFKEDNLDFDMNSFKCWASGKEVKLPVLAKMQGLTTEKMVSFADDVLQDIFELFDSYLYVGKADALLESSFVENWLNKDEELLIKLNEVMKLCK